jgi:mono/diheme cytochrome c family protein
MAAAASGPAVPPPEPPASAVRGKALAERRCARCHAVGPAGASPYPIAPPFREIARRYPVENLEEALGEGIVVGHPEMPKFELDAQQIQDLLEYLRSLRQPMVARSAGPAGGGGR